MVVNMTEIISGIKDIKIVDLPETLRCAKKVIEHIRKKQEEGYLPKGKVQYFEKPSDYEKCVRSTLVKTGLLTFCSLGLGKSVCESFDIIKDEEKRLGRRLTDSEIYQIVVSIGKKYGIIDENFSDELPVHKLDNKGGQIVEQCL